MQRVREKRVEKIAYLYGRHELKHRETPPYQKKTTICTENEIFAANPSKCTY